MEIDSRRDKTRKKIQSKLTIKVGNEKMKKTGRNIRANGSRTTEMKVKQEKKIQGICLEQKGEEQRRGEEEQKKPKKQLKHTRKQRESQCGKVKTVLQRS